MNKEVKRQCYKLMLTKPSWSDPQIAKSLGISRGVVFRTRKTLLSTIDYELAQNVAGKFLVEFQMASDYFKLQIERLDELKEQKNTVLLKDGSIEEIPLNPLEILAIEKQQTELWKNIIEFASQGEAVEVMRLIRDGKIQPLTN
jgi:hypothetical protein